VLGTARLAAIMLPTLRHLIRCVIRWGGKRGSGFDLPEVSPDGNRPVGLRIKAIARSTAKTGVEMEALTAVSIAALTIYDMCKSIDKTMVISGVRLLSKTGGTVL